MLFRKIIYFKNYLKNITTMRGKNAKSLCVKLGARGEAVVEVLRYKPEGRGIDSR
jgi:hypothetical protein